MCSHAQKRSPSSWAAEAAATRDARPEETRTTTMPLMFAKALHSMKDHTACEWRAVALASLLLGLSGRAAGTNSPDAWHPAVAPLMTRWAAEVSPNTVLPEYPRPQLVRSDWLNLNGLWDYARLFELFPAESCDMPVLPKNRHLQNFHLWRNNRWIAPSPDVMRWAVIPRNNH